MRTRSPSDSRMAFALASLLVTLAIDRAANVTAAILATKQIATEQIE